MQTISIKFLILLSASLILVSCGNSRSLSSEQEAWDDANAPSQLLRDYEVSFATLPQSGESEMIPWPDSYWPNFRGGIAYRWRTGALPWNVSTYSQSELQSLDPDVLRQLSPAEKFDILRGRYDYPMTNRERERTSPNHPGWWGLCHGWAPASIVFEEPHPVTMTNADGITLELGSADIKALLTYVQQDRAYGGEVDFLGLRCNGQPPDDTPINTPECKGVNSGSFHIILTNQIGLNQTPFIMDIVRYSEVWNQPVYGYEVTILNDDGDVYDSAAPGTTRIVEVSTKIKYLIEQGPYHEAIGDRNVGQFGRRTYRYTIELNASDEIIGGEWLGEDRPDFLWSQQPGWFLGPYEIVGDIYEQSIQGP